MGAVGRGGSVQRRGGGGGGGGRGRGHEHLGALPAEDTIIEEFPHDAEGHALVLGCFVGCVFVGGLSDSGRCTKPCTHTYIEW